MLESKKRFPKLFRDDLQDLIVNYRANLIAKLSITHLGFPASTQAENQAILLRLQALEPIGNREDLSIFSVLEENQKITIIGTPGSGKTTLLKLITLLASRGILSNISKFPVLLKPHSSGKETSIEKEIRREIEDISKVKLSDQILSKLLTQNKVLLLIDGLDETSTPEHYENSVLNFIDKFPETRIIITSRPTIAPRKLNFPAFQIAPLTNNEIRQLIDLWSVDKPKIADQFWTAVQESLGLLSLASNPLLLRLMFENYQRQGVIPDDRNKLQETYLNFLLSFTSNLRSEDLKSFTEKIALFLHQKKEVLFSKNDIRFHIFDLQEAEGKTDNFEAQITQLLRSNILESQGINHYRFSHLLLQEYFCANSLQRLPQKKLVDFFIEFAGDKWWESVFSILAQKLSTANDIVPILLQEKDAEIWLLAAKLILKNKNVKEEFRLRSTRNLCDLLSWDKPEIALRASDLLIQFNEPEIERNCLSIIDRYEGKKPLATTSATYVLASMGKEYFTFYRLLASALQDSNFLVRSQACKALGALNNKQSTELLIDTLGIENNKEVLEQTISSLCRINVSRKVDSSKLAELRIELNKLKHAPNKNEELRTWVEQLEAELATQKPSFEA